MKTFPTFLSFLYILEKSIPIGFSHRQIDCHLCNKNIKIHLELLVMWLVAFESMTHLEEEEIRHVLGLPNSTSIVMRIEANINDS